MLYVFLSVAIPTGLYVVFLGVSAARTGYTWTERDWNGDGSTSIAEYLHSTNVGTRPVTSRGRLCREFFEIESGRPVRVTCGR